MHLLQSVSPPGKMIPFDSTSIQLSIILMPVQIVLEVDQSGEDSLDEGIASHGSSSDSDEEISQVPDDPQSVELTQTSACLLLTSSVLAVDQREISTGVVAEQR